MHREKRSVYIVRKLKLNDSCSGCLALLTDKSSSVTEENLFIHFKVHRHNDNSPFGSLHVPSSSFLHFLQRIEALFQRNIIKYMASYQVLSKLLGVISTSVPSRTLNICKQHRRRSLPISIMACYLRCRLHYYFKFETRQILQQKAAGRRNRKLQVLQHKQ